MKSRPSRMTAALIIGRVAFSGEPFLPGEWAGAVAGAAEPPRILSDVIFRQKEAVGSADLTVVQTQLFPPPPLPSPSPVYQGPLSFPMAAPTAPPCPAPLALRIGYEIVFDLPGAETTLLFLLYAHP